MGIWGLGFLFGLIRLIRGTYSLHVISQAGKLFNYKQSSLELKDIQLITHPAVITPMTWGFKQPYILLPEEAINWSVETLNTVLAHEQAHIQRKDYWIHTLSLISLSFYWFHPMCWWMKRRQLIEREKACDEFVLNNGHSKQNYAEDLVKVARQIAFDNRISNSYALPMANVNELKDRLYAILQFQKARFQFNKIKQGQWAGFYVSIILLLSAFTPIDKHRLGELFVEKIPSLNVTSISSIDDVVRSKVPTPDIQLLNNHPSNKNSPVVSDNIVDHKEVILNSKISSLQPQRLPINITNNINTPTKSKIVYSSPETEYTKTTLPG